MRPLGPRPHRISACLAKGCILATLSARAAFAADVAPADNAAPPPPPSAGQSEYLLGDMWGLRPLLSQYGMTFNLQETSEVLGNVSGGIHRGAAYDGLTQMVLQLDTERAFGWHGGTFTASALQIHGRDLSADNLASLQTASGIEANRGTRLWEVWYQQKFLLDDRIDIKVGQQSIDQEFIVSQNAGLFVNTAFGWPMLPTADLPGGGPAYPLSALGVRVLAHPTDSVTLLAGVFNGSPIAGNAGDPQRSNPSGTRFPLNGGALAIAEMQYTYPSAGAAATPKAGESLAGTYKLGIWYDTERFADLRYDTAGRSLANPASNGIAQSHAGNYSLYAVADQMVWRSSAEPGRNINVFLRLMGAPQADRNLIAFSANAGLTMHQPFPNRDDDSVGIGMGYAKVGGRASQLDQDTAAFDGRYVPVRSGETFAEITYQYQATPWLQLQPDAQYVLMPGGGVPDPGNPGRRVRNEAVFGLRSVILF